MRVKVRLLNPTAVKSRSSSSFAELRMNRLMQLFSHYLSAVCLRQQTDYLFT